MGHGSECRRPAAWVYLGAGESDLGARQWRRVQEVAETYAVPPALAMLASYRSAARRLGRALVWFGLVCGWAAWLAPGPLAELFRWWDSASPEQRAGGLAFLVMLTAGLVLLVRVMQVLWSLLLGRPAWRDVVLQAEFDSGVRPGLRDRLAAAWGDVARVFEARRVGRSAVGER